MLQHSYLSNTDTSSIEDMYQNYLADPKSVDMTWQKFFEGFDFALGKTGLQAATVSEDSLKEIKVLNLINYGYRTRGHLFTHTNPVRERRKYTPDLAIENFGLNHDDLEKTFNAGSELGLNQAKLKDIIAFLEKTYCNNIGVEYMYILEPEKRSWLQQKIEQNQNTPNFDIDKKRRILEKLNQASVFENFLHTKYIGQKRFSLEGLEGLIPALDSVINKGSEVGVQEFVLGMAHRGRLNVLVNIMGKNYEEVFNEFEGKAYSDAIFEGDVKYHKGYTSLLKTSNGKDVKLKLAANPSHLEAVNPVVKGMARAKLNADYSNDVNKIAPILIHGDASIAGQGIVYEVVQMSGLNAYNVGGTIHIVTNNQIGFTTNYLDARTSIYCTDVAKTTKCPVFHVNADDAEAIVLVMELAMEYRQKFHSDVFIDLLGYRKYGHNEGDEPRFTQPLLYKAIANHPSPREIYSQYLTQSGAIEAEMSKEMEQIFKKTLQEKLDYVKSNNEVSTNDMPSNKWKGYRKSENKDFETSPDTKVSKNIFTSIAESISSLPQSHLPINKIQKLYEDRKAMITKDSFDWAMGELMAYATLLNEGYPVRMTGQDCERGTFSHRHAVIKKEDTEQEYIPLNNINDIQAKIEIQNSFLSEYAVLGFEYGFACILPKTLTIWEAQFGDFANGAQIIIDQFISSGETKWKQFNGLVLLLPHGYEGQGPEHSSSRVERFLQLAANGCMQIVNPSTPAQFFHVLRRQLHRDFRTPLVVITPKSLLRHPLCISTMSEFTEGKFQEIIDDTKADIKKTKRVLMCNGKIYYELLQRKAKDYREDIAIVRIEQLYPLAENQLKSIFDKYSNTDIYWVQEEPKNMGAWLHLKRYDFAKPIKLISRKSSSTPATGYASVHAQEQEQIIFDAFDV